MVQFRKSKKSGPLRFTVSKRGVGGSVGAGPVRLGLGSDGRVRRSWRIPGTGVYGTKTYGGSRRQRRGRGMSFMAWLGWAFIALVAWVACTDSGSKPDEPGKPWAAAPKDGIWPSGVSGGAVPFGETSPALLKSQGARAFDTDYTFVISSPPELTTYDDGKNVWITSTLTVKRVDNHDNFNGQDPVTRAMKVIFEPGETSDSYTMDESHGTHPDVKCTSDKLTVGQSTTCTLSFKAPASEIQNSYWSVDGWNMGTWPSQGEIEPSPTSATPDTPSVTSGG